MKAKSKAAKAVVKIRAFQKSVTRHLSKTNVEAEKEEDDIQTEREKEKEEKEEEEEKSSSDASSLSFLSSDSDDSTPSQSSHSDIPKNESPQTASSEPPTPSPNTPLSPSTPSNAQPPSVPTPEADNQADADSDATHSYHDSDSSDDASGIARSSTPLLLSASQVFNANNEKADEPAPLPAPIVLFARPDYGSTTRTFSSESSPLGISSLSSSSSSESESTSTPFPPSNSNDIKPEIEGEHATISDDIKDDPFLSPISTPIPTTPPSDSSSSGTTIDQSATTSASPPSPSPLLMELAIALAQKSAAVDQLISVCFAPLLFVRYPLRFYPITITVPSSFTIKSILPVLLVHINQSSGIFRANSRPSLTAPFTFNAFTNPFSDNPPLTFTALRSDSDDSTDDDSSDDTSSGNTTHNRNTTTLKADKDALSSRTLSIYSPFSVIFSHEFGIDPSDRKTEYPLYTIWISKRY